MEETEEMCKRISSETANRLNAIAKEEMRICPKCGNTFNEDEIEEETVYDDDGDEEIFFKCPECGNIEDSEDAFEEFSISEWLNEVLDIRVIVDLRDFHNQSPRLIGAHIQTSTGGPSTWVLTDDEYVETYYGRHSERAFLECETCDKINDLIENLIAA